MGYESRLPDTLHAYIACMPASRYVQYRSSLRSCLPPLEGRAQVLYAIKRVNHHVCFVFWCGKSPALCRYDPGQNILVCDELGVYYPVVHGIARLSPGAGHLLDSEHNLSQTVGPQQ